MMVDTGAALLECEARADALYGSVRAMLEAGKIATDPDIKQLLIELEAALVAEGEALERHLAERRPRIEATEDLLKRAAALIQSCEGIISAAEVQAIMDREARVKALVDRGDLVLGQRPRLPPRPTGINLPPDIVAELLDEVRGEHPKASLGDLWRTANWLAEEHRRNDEEMIRVFMVRPELNNDDVIRLLEVTNGVMTTREILPFTFAAQPHKGCHFAWTVTLVSEEEFDEVLVGELDLPENYGVVEDLEEIYESFNHGAPAEQLSRCDIPRGPTLLR